MILQGNKILIKEIKEEAKTSSGILLSTPQETYKKGEVMFSGPGHYQNGIFIPNKLHIGAKVLYSYGNECVIGGETYQLTDDSNIIATLK